jgi:hypothetical protein
MTVQRFRLYCFATQDFGYVQISLGNTAIAVGACMQQTSRFREQSSAEQIDTFWLQTKHSGLRRRL